MIVFLRNTGRPGGLSQAVAVRPSGNGRGDRSRLIFWGMMAGLAAGDGFQRGDVGVAPGGHVGGDQQRGDPSKVMSSFGTIAGSPPGG